VSAEGFSVDYGFLGDLAQKLADLRGEFERGADALEPVIRAAGHEELGARLREFTANWSDRRDQVVGQLDSAAGFARQAADVYRQTDEALARSHTAGPAVPGGR
jgi:ABC-type transporter Mla subunit MlaD